MRDQLCSPAVASGIVSSCTVVTDLRRGCGGLSAAEGAVLDNDYSQDPGAIEIGLPESVGLDFQTVNLLYENKFRELKRNCRRRNRKFIFDLSY